MDRWVREVSGDELRGVDQIDGAQCGVWSAKRGGIGYLAVDTVEAGEEEQSRDEQSRGTGK